MKYVLQRYTLLFMLFGENCKFLVKSVLPGYIWRSICIVKTKTLSLYCLCIQGGMQHRWSVGSTAKNIEPKNDIYMLSPLKKKKKIQFNL